MTCLRWLVLAATSLGCTVCLADQLPIVTPGYGADGDGIARLRIVAGQTSDRASAAHALQDGSLILGGLSSGLTPGATARFSLARLTAEGRPDATFGTNGIGSVLLDMGPVHTMADVHATSSGDIVFTGWSVQNTGVVGKVRSDGRLAAEFGENGRRFIGGGVFFDSAVAFIPRRLVELQSGKLLVVGLATSAQQACAGIVRLSVQGELDSSFGGDGAVCLAPAREGSPNAIGNEVLEMPNGDLLVAGAAMRAGGAGYDMFVVRTTSAGVPDTSFGSSGSGYAFANFDRGGKLDDQAHALALDAAGRILIAGVADVDASTHANDMAIARLTSSGRPDVQFGQGGRVMVGDVSPTTANRDAGDIAFQRDGRILLGGRTHAASMVATAVLLLEDGSLDTGFASGGIFTQADASAPSTAVVDPARHNLILRDDTLYIVGGIALPQSPDVGRVDAFAAARFALPLFGNGFDPR